MRAARSRASISTPGSPITTSPSTAAIPAPCRPSRSRAATFSSTGTSTRRRSRFWRGARAGSIPAPSPASRSISWIMCRGPGSSTRAVRLEPQALPFESNVFDLTGRVVDAADASVVAREVESAFVTLLQAESATELKRSDDGSIIRDEIEAKFAARRDLGCRARHRALAPRRGGGAPRDEIFRRGGSGPR